MCFQNKEARHQWKWVVRVIQPRRVPLLQFPMTQLRPSSEEHQNTACLMTVWPSTRSYSRTTLESEWGYPLPDDPSAHPWLPRDEGWNQEHGSFGSYFNWIDLGPSQVPQYRENWLIWPRLSDGGKKKGHQHIHRLLLCVYDLWRMRASHCWKKEH